MLRLLATLSLGIALGYCAFFVKLDGKTLGGHGYDIWVSPVVQQKLKMIAREVPKAIRAQVPEPAPLQRLKRAVSAPPAAGKQEQHSEKDRTQLDATVHEIARKRS